MFQLIGSLTVPPDMAVLIPSGVPAQESTIPASRDSEFTHLRSRQ
jgi:hypothetical protein